MIQRWREIGFFKMNNGKEEEYKTIRIKEPTKKEKKNGTYFEDLLAEKCKEGQLNEKNFRRVTWFNCKIKNGEKQYVACLTYFK